MQDSNRKMNKDEMCFVCYLPPRLREAPKIKQDLYENVNKYEKIQVKYLRVLAARPFCFELGPPR